MSDTNTTTNQDDLGSIPARRVWKTQDLKVSAEVDMAIWEHIALAKEVANEASTLFSKMLAEGHTIEEVNACAQDMMYHTSRLIDGASQEVIIHHINTNLDKFD